MATMDLVTAADVLRMPNDGNRYEAVHGELLVTPAPGTAHQFFLERLHWELSRYLRPHGIEELMLAPADITFGPDTLVQPDLFVADLSGFTSGGRWEDIRTLHLVVEVVSPSSVRADRFTKRRLYQEQGIPCYWMLDAGERTVDVWVPGADRPAIERVELRWRHPALSEECVVDVERLFAAR